MPRPGSRPRHSSRQRNNVLIPLRATVTGVALLLAGGCAEPYADRRPTAAAPPAATAPPPLDPIGRFTLSGQLIQGGLVRGTAPAGTATLTFDGQPVPVAPDGGFLIGFDRDSGPAARLVATLRDGRTVSEPLTIAPRAWNISRLGTLPKYPVPAPEFERVRPGELVQINAARAQRITSDGWRQPFQWPSVGRISTLFGSQRIYKNGEAGSYHSGVDVAKPTGSVVLAPADGVVTLATTRPFTLEGYLVLVDHGAGLNSAFMHLARIDVAVGQTVRRGQPLGTVGATGRATGPHLHWGMRWNAARIDPLLVAGPMPAAN